MSQLPTRRDLLLGMTALGAGGGTTIGRAHTATPNDIDTLLAVAEVIYPTAVSVDRSFIESSVRSRVPMREGYFSEQTAALDQLEVLTKRRSGRSFVTLAPRDRERMLERLGVRTAHPIPDGTSAERIRFYVINDLLYVLYAHPKGGELVSCENPPGYLGGRTAYRRGDLS